MTCCFTPRGVLTRAEREAIARLRERRAAGTVPHTVAHPAVHEQTDTLVSFYSGGGAGAGGEGGGGARARERAKLVKKKAERRVRKVRVSGRVAVKRLSAKAAAKHAKHAKAARNAPVLRDDVRVLAHTQRSARPPQEPCARAPVLDAIKAISLWHAVKREQPSSQPPPPQKEHGQPAAADTWDTHVARIKDATRKRLHHVRSRIAGAGAAAGGGAAGWGERFTARQKVDESDLNEANNDRYFQQLMSAER